ncbi:sugar transferase [Pseudidiomarina sp. E22-M8]|uniref:sugar transferase n=1 Tax=Pseudidiomarina sp. E22-M8 TaxID=3424768 RepID=UPI00403D49E6
MTKFDKLAKRTFDILLSLVLIIILWPIILICWLLVSFETKSHGLFVQKRVGQNAAIFNVYKLKTMINKGAGNRPSITTANMKEITKLGRVYRRYKLDELPQLFNVLKGDMSFVGPRPDVPGYADKLTGEDRMILDLRPGITGPASIKYKDEETLLSQKGNAREYNDLVIWPDKIKINKKYIQEYSFMKDLVYIIKTLKS